MTDRELMQQALDALCDIIPANANRKEIDRIQHAAITALRERLAQPAQQEPVLETVYETIVHWDEGGGKRSRRELARRIVALFTAPPQRTWVGLTDEDIEIAFDDTQEGGGFDDFARAIEAKLKEKNT